MQELPALTARYGMETLFVPVPLTKEKRRLRGYNQAQELGEVVVEYLRQVGVAAELSVDILEATGARKQQKNLGMSERRENAEQAYRLRKRKVCAGKVVVLIDDILTTGATGSACARLLNNAKASCVVLLTIAALPERR